MQEKSILYYDGECKLCNAWLSFLRRVDKRNRMEYKALQSENGKAILKNLNSKYESLDTVVFEKNNELYIRSEAVINCLSEIGGGWNAMKLLRIVPLKFRDFIYNFIAQNRYHWFGKMDKC